MTRRLLGEGLGTALLLFVIVGSGFSAETFGNDPGGALFAHSIAVGLGLAGLIVMFQTVSGAHFNPSVTLAFWRTNGMSGRLASAYIGVQLFGAVAGVVAANVSFEETAFVISDSVRNGYGLILAEAIATFVLVLMVLALALTNRTAAIPAAVGAWVAAIIFATSSTGFANPAVTVARMLTDSYTGIAPVSITGFLFAQIAAGFAAAAAVSALFPNTTDSNQYDKEAPMSTVPKPSVLFLCVHNAGRSQMAAGWMRHIAGHEVDVFSGGSEPAEQINQTAVAAMKEKGIDISAEIPQPWADEAIRSADVVVTMGCGDTCPVFPGKRYVDWELTDPADKPLEAVRLIRDDIEQRVRNLLAELKSQASQ